MRQKFSPSRFARLIAWSALLIVCWTIVLPALSGQPAMRARLDRRKQQGINAGAMYYTELNAMPRVMERMDRLHAAHGDVFWRRSAAMERR